MNITTDWGLGMGYPCPSVLSLPFASTNLFNYAATKMTSLVLSHTPSFETSLGQ